MQQIKEFIRTHKHMWWGLYLPVYLAMYFTVEHFITDNYWATQTAIDYKIPFLEGFIVPYDSWGPLLFVLGVYLIFKDPECFRRYMWTIAIAYTTATLFCALVPNGQDLRPVVMPRHNIFTAIVQATYNADTNTNVFPSVHVLGTVAAWTAIAHTPGLKKSGWRVFAIIWGAIIVAGTLFVKQHAFIDVAAGLIWGGAVCLLVWGVIGKRRDKRGLRCGPPQEEGAVSNENTPDAHL